MSYKGVIVVSISIEALLQIQGLDTRLDSLDRKERKKTCRKLRRILKKLEFMRRTGGITVVSEGDHIITTYLNNSLDRSKKLNKNKVIY